MNYKFIKLLFFVTIFLTSAKLVEAADYVPLVGIPGLAGPLNFDSYIDALYALSISIAALLAVIKIIIAGMKYMLSDIVNTKSEAISDIQGSVFGLIIVISAVLILTIINPNLADIEITFEQIDPPPAKAVVPTGTTVNVFTGYTSAKVGTVPAGFTSFKAYCAANPKNIYALVSPNEICFNQLPVAFETDLLTLYAAFNAGGGVMVSPFANMDAVIRRYQTAHYPRLITGAGKKDAIKAEKGAGKVLIAISLSSPLDWIDSSNTSQLKDTCDDFQRITGENVTYVNGKMGTPDAYIACITKP